ncbi:CBS domain-containing protein [Almyronema epifaneia]|uniref:histidine kinase n=1 Tax=Almyronema epifaneia S1 TaxID=2991925 RepID=A0ABW6IBT0_9CYAN
MLAELNKAILQNVLVVEPDLPLLEAIVSMSNARSRCHLLAGNTDPFDDHLAAESRASCLCVVSQGQLVGILTERDIIRLTAKAQITSAITVADVMTCSVIALKQSEFTNIFVALNLFRERRIRHLPIVDEAGQLVGLLTHESLRQLLQPADLLRLRLISELMPRQVIGAAVTDTVFQVTELMATHGVSCVVIVEKQTIANEAAGTGVEIERPVGIVTERDIVQFQAIGLDVHQIQVGAVMSSPVFALKPKDSLWAAHLLMQERRVQRIAVVGDYGELLGIITQTTLLQALDPIEAYKLVDVLKQRISQLEAEKIELLQSQNIELQRQVSLRTEALKQQADCDRLLAQTSAHIRSTLDLQQILDTTVSEVQQFLDCDRLLIYRFAPDWRGCVVAEAIKPNCQSLLNLTCIDPHFGENLVEDYCQGRIQQTADIYASKLSTCYVQLLASMGVRATLIVPILQDSRLWGLLTAQMCYQPRTWHVYETELLKQLSTQVAIAIQQSELYQQSQNELRERELAEASRAESESRLRSIVDNAPSQILMLNRAGKILFANRRGTSESLPQLTGDDLSDYVPTSVEPLYQESLAAVFEHGKTVSFEAPGYTFEGDIAFYQTRIAPVWQNQRVESAVMIATDVSDRKRVEAELQAEEFRLRCLTNAIPGAVYQYRRSPTGEQSLLYMSQGVAEIYEVSLAQVQANTQVIADRIPPEDRSRLLSAIEDSAKHLTFFEVEHRVVIPNKPLKWVTSRAIPYLEADGSIIWYGITLDITARKHAEELLQRVNQDLEARVVQRTAELAESEAKFRLFVEHAPAAVAMFDRQMHYLAVSARWLLDYGLGDRDVIGLSHYQVFPDTPQAWKEIHQRCLAGAIETCEEDPFPRFDGSIDWLRWEVHPWYDAQGAIGGIIIFTEVITARKQAEAALKQSEVALRQANERLTTTNAELARATRLKDEFLANISHELRTPLNAILGLSEGLKDQVYGPLTAKQHNSLATIERSGQHLLELINDILDLSKAEAGKLELQVCLTDVFHLCNSSLAFIRQQANRKRIQLCVSVPDTVALIEVDERRLRQVLINLLSNAVKFTPDGGQVELAVRVESPEILFVVSDTGIGIAPENMSKLFAAFVQIDSSLSRQHQGTGLGLALVRRLSELHGGTVEVESEVAKGSRFTVRLPYRDSQVLTASQSTAIASQRVLAAHAAASTPDSDQRQPLVLIADDNEANIETIADYLSCQGYRLLLAKNGVEAVRLAVEQKPDLILMDIQMPEMDGLTAIQQIRQQSALRQVPIVALTALAMTGDRDRCLAAGAAAYLTKPVSLRHLVHTIRGLLSR